MTEKREYLTLSESLSVQLHVSEEWKELNSEVVAQFKEYLKNHIIDEDGNNSISIETILMTDEEDLKIYIQQLFFALYETRIIGHRYYPGGKSYVYGGQSN